MDDYITLSDKKRYVVCSKIQYEDNKYLYLINLADYKDVKFGVEKLKSDKIFITEIEDEELIRHLLPLFYSEAKNIINEEEF